MLFETLNLHFRYFGKTTTILFSQTNPNVQECTQPENRSKNKKPPAHIYFLKKSVWESNNFFFGPDHFEDWAFPGKSVVR